MVGRAELLSAVFFMLSLIAYKRAIQGILLQMSTLHCEQLTLLHGLHVHDIVYVLF